MFKVDINASFCLSKPLLTPNQSHVFVRYGQYLNSSGVLTSPQAATATNGYNNKILVPWTEILEQRGDITAYITDPRDALKAGLITVTTPGVYMISGFLQFKAVTGNAVDGMEVNLRYNKNAVSFEQSAKIANVKDGGVPFTFVKLVQEEDINFADAATQKVLGEAYFQINVSYSGGGYSSLSLVDNDGRFVWCAVTHLG